MAGPDASGSEERALVEAAQAGDQASLRVLLDRFARPLYAAVILPRVGNTADAEEILRDTLLRSVERLSTFHWTGVGFYPWLRQIGVNLVIDHVRRSQRRMRLAERVERQADVLPLHHAGAEEMLIEQQERAVALRMMTSALDQLNERYRRAVELRLLEERSRDDCAAALGVTVGNFDVILHRALAALKKAYGVR